jgi:hypothetical protein
MVSLTYDREAGVALPSPKHIQVSVSHHLAAVFARAAVVNSTDPMKLSFTSMLVGMVTGSDPVSVWLKTELEKYSATAQKIALGRSSGFEESSLRSISGESVPPLLATSMSARQAIEEAQAIAAAVGSGPVLDVRHVAAAYPILPDWHDEDFKSLGIDRLAWARGFGAFMAGAYPAEKAYWGRYADRASPVPLTSFSADVYTEQDLLGIDRGVEALALLIASTRTDTPLSVGVFGPWGSGKSFFMRHLRKRIWGLAAREQKRVDKWIGKRQSETATADDAPLYYGQVAQVEFNAWHYNEGNLVASLVDHLFRNLRVLPGKDDAELERRRAEVLNQIREAEGETAETTRAVAEKQKEIDDTRDEVRRANDAAAEARQEVDKKSQELTNSTAEAEAARKELDAAIRDLAAAPETLDAAAVVAIALDAVTNSPGLAEVKAATNEFVTDLVDWQKFLRRLWSPRAAAVVLLCVAVPLAGWLASAFSDTLAALLGVIATGLAGAGRVMEVLRERRREFEAELKVLEATEAELVQKRMYEVQKKQKQVKEAWDKKLQELGSALETQRSALADRERAVTAAARALAEQTKALDTLVQQRLTAEASLRGLEAELKRLSSAVLLDEFLKDRSGTNEYRKELGLLALVRRDFERLSDLIAAANKEWCAPNKQTPAPLLNRIVLYIDDLDRCTIEKVIQVLEAVHLLLAFPLFVCVVAVDPRWVEKCLRQKHEQLFVDEARDGAGVTVGDYLEKIFQIPIWMSPIEGAQRAQVVKSLLGTTAAPILGGAARPALARPDPPPPPRTGGGSVDAVARAEATPDPLNITPLEAAFVDDVAALLSDKPRALKRFVNTYRLLKASLPDISRQTFVSDGPASPFRICISQLAFFTGRPRLAPLLVRQLTEAEKDDVKLQTWFESLPSDTRTALEKGFRLIPGTASVTVREFREWLPATSKYLFHRDDVERNPPAAGRDQAPLVPSESSAHGSKTQS